MTNDLGTLEQSGDQWRLTFTRRLPHPQEKVWRAVSEAEHMAAWFPMRMDGERRAGATLRFITDAETSDGFDGEMLVFDPPSVMELMWGTDRLRIELRPDGDGTILTLADTFPELGKAARDASGWHDRLAHLVAHLDGDPAPGDVWRKMEPVYKDAFGPEASTIGPPTG